MQKVIMFSGVIHALNETGHSILASKIIEAAATGELPNHLSAIFNCLCEIGHHTLANDIQSIIDTQNNKEQVR